MGKTFRREKTFGSKRKENQGMGKKPRLNTHRDLPDYQGSLDEEYPFDELEAEEYYAKAIHSKTEHDLGRESSEAPKDHRG